MWLLSLLWVEKGKGRRHLGLTWNRGQLMIQFREAFLLSLRLGIFAAASQVVSNRHHSPSPTAQRSLSDLTSRAMLGSAVAHFTCVTCVRAHSSVPPLLCIRSMIMQHATRAIYTRFASPSQPAGLPPYSRPLLMRGQETVPALTELALWIPTPAPTDYMYIVLQLLHTGGKTVCKGHHLATATATFRGAVSTSDSIHTVVLLARSLARAKMVRRSAIYSMATRAPFLLEVQPNLLVLLQQLHRDRLAWRSNGYGLSRPPILALPPVA